MTTLTQCERTQRWVACPSCDSSCCPVCFSVLLLGDDSCCVFATTCLGFQSKSMGILRSLATGCSPSDHDTASSLLQTMGSMCVLKWASAQSINDSKTYVPCSLPSLGDRHCVGSPSTSCPPWYMVCSLRSSSTFKQLASKKQGGGGDGGGRRLTQHLSLRVGHAWDMESGLGGHRNLVTDQVQALASPSVMCTGCVAW